MSQNQDEKIFAIVNRKGGVAKTTLACNLAYGLSRKLMAPVDPQDIPADEQDYLVWVDDVAYTIDGHVLLIDFDPQGNCATALGVRADGADIGELLTGRQTLREAVVSADRSDEGIVRPNLWLIPASDNLVSAKTELIAQGVGRAMSGRGDVRQMLLMSLESRLRDAVNRFDYIIIDCPPTMDAFTEAVYQFCDAAIVPIRADFLSTTGAAQHLHEIRQAQLSGIDIRVHTIVPTFYNARYRLDQDMYAALVERYSKTVIADPIPRAQKVAEAPAANGMTLFEFDPQETNKATSAMHALVERVYHG